MQSVEARLHNIEKRLTDVESRFDERSKTLFNRTEELSVFTKAITDLTGTVRELAYRMTQAGKSFDALKSKVYLIEGAPGKRWQTVTTAIITAVTSGVIGFFIARFLQ